jgi:hypothetical protein
VVEIDNPVIRHATRRTLDPPFVVIDPMFMTFQQNLLCLMITESTFESSINLIFGGQRDSKIIFRIRFIAISAFFHLLIIPFRTQLLKSQKCITNNNNTRYYCFYNSFFFCRDIGILPLHGRYRLHISLRPKGSLRYIQPFRILSECRDSSATQNSPPLILVVSTARDSVY